ncbi:MAG: imidazoleglycerol-phosphate dehydratase HisB [Leptospiraceae bacterium]|nr:imidazoleglycerol-phosphate dehydratase HisB [Leptospiraceae bacterium]MDW7976422.1 imidazoleglycerol-phosphate dehydratase HisB [Leptospiraceae bacterium]
MRKQEIERKTNETYIRLILNLDGNGSYKLDTQIPFFDHMLSHLSKHSGMDINLFLRGDIEIDCHHSVEDTAIVLGRALHDALGDKKGISRYGHFTLPMDEVLTTVALDLSGRFYFKYQGPDLRSMGKFGIYDSELTLEFLEKFASNAKMNLHVMVHYGENRHHIHESIFKALGRALKMAIQRNNQEIASTKGILE